MVSIRASKFLNFVEDEGIKKSLERLELDVDTVDELPDGELDGVVLAHGSAAFVIGTGELYKIDSSGAWHNVADGSTPQTDGGDGE